MHNKKAILFDLDGVTIDTEALYTISQIRLFREYGVEIPKDDLSLFRGCSEKTFFDLSIKRYGINENRDLFIEKGRKHRITAIGNKMAIRLAVSRTDVAHVYPNESK